jgi:hypothetical protein
MAAWLNQPCGPAWVAQPTATTSLTSPRQAVGVGNAPGAVTTPRPPVVVRLPRPHQQGSFNKVFTHHTVAVWGEGRARRGGWGLTGEAGRHGGGKERRRGGIFGWQQISREQRWVLSDPTAAWTEEGLEERI